MSTAKADGHIFLLYPHNAQFDRLIITVSLCEFVIEIEMSSEGNSVKFHVVLLCGWVGVKPFRDHILFITFSTSTNCLGDQEGGVGMQKWARGQQTSLRLTAEQWRLS